MITDDEAKEWVKKNQHIFKVVDKCMKQIEALEDHERESAVIMILTNMVMNTCNSQGEAVDCIAHVANRSAMAMSEFSENGLCAWNATRQ